MATTRVQNIQEFKILITRIFHNYYIHDNSSKCAQFCDRTFIFTKYFITSLDTFIYFICKLCIKLLLYIVQKWSTLFSVKCSQIDNSFKMYSMYNIVLIKRYFLTVTKYFQDNNNATSNERVNYMNGSPCSSGSSFELPKNSVESFSINIFINEYKHKWQ